VSLFGAGAQDSHKVEYEEMDESAERRKEEVVKYGRRGKRREVRRVEEMR
jgi:hypothetical protein